MTFKQFLLEKKKKKKSSKKKKRSYNKRYPYIWGMSAHYFGPYADSDGNGDGGGEG